MWQTKTFIFKLKIPHSIILLILLIFDKYEIKPLNTTGVHVQGNRHQWNQFLVYLNILWSSIKSINGIQAYFSDCLKDCPCHSSLSVDAKCCELRYLKIAAYWSNPFTNTIYHLCIRPFPDTPKFQKVWSLRVSFSKMNIYGF